MLILIVFVLFILSMCLFDYYYSDLAAFLAFVFGSSCLLMIVILLANHYIDYPSFKVKVESARQTIEMARQGNEIERAAIINKAVEINEEIAKAQYWNQVWWADAFYPDDVMNLQLIK
jgi:hypothetical protein